MIQNIPATWTLQDLMSVLGKTSEKPGFRTTREWAQHFGIGVEKMQALLAEADAAGMLLRERVQRRRFDLVNTTTWAYSFVLDEEGHAGPEVQV